MNTDYRKIVFFYLEGNEMYSHEIQATMEQHEWALPSKVYLNILYTSPQIRRTKFSPYGEYFEMWTDDNYYWRFYVYLEE